MAKAAAAQDASLELNILGLEKVKGRVEVAVFQDAESYESGTGVIATATVDVTAKTMTISLKGIEPGPCAIKVFHDVNANGALDTNLIGLPKEPFGFSNQAKARFGPPKFEEARFNLSEGSNTHAIRVAGLTG